MNPLNLQLIVILLATIEHVRDQNRLLTEREAQQILGVSYDTMARLRKARQIEFIRFEGGDIRYKREHLEAFIQKREVPTQKLRLKSVA